MATAVRNVRSLMNISRFMIQSTACKASAVSVVHSRSVSSLNRRPNFTNQLRPVRIHSDGGNVKHVEVVYRSTVFSVVKKLHDS